VKTHKDTRTLSATKMFVTDIVSGNYKVFANIREDFLERGRETIMVV